MNNMAEELVKAWLTEDVGLIPMQLKNAMEHENYNKLIKRIEDAFAKVKAESLKTRVKVESKTTSKEK